MSFIRDNAVLHGSMYGCNSTQDTGAIHWDACSARIFPCELKLLTLQVSVVAKGNVHVSSRQYLALEPEEPGL